jgi:hypothetical protein
MTNFNFHLGSLDLAGPDDGLTNPDTPIVVGRLSSPSGTSQNLFASPLSSMSQATGVTSTVKVGLLYSESVDQWCWGLIGGEGKNRICCKAIGQCTTKSHKLNKGIVRNKHFHIRGIKENQMLIEPSLDGEVYLKLKLTI